MGNIPTKPPTLPPTPYPTMSPTPYPTVSPFSWKINGTEWRVGFGDDSASSEIIGTYDMTPTRDYHFDVLKEDCSTAIDDYAVKVVGNTRDGQVPFEGKVEVEIDIDPEKISSSSVFKDSNAPNIKNIRICVKSFLKLGEVSVTFHETILSIFVNMAKNFQIDDIVTDRREAKQENETVDSIATIDISFVLTEILPSLIHGIVLLMALSHQYTSKEVSSGYVSMSPQLMFHLNLYCNLVSTRPMVVQKVKS